MSQAQKKWCMKAAVPAGTLICKLQEIHEFLSFPRDFAGVNIEREIKVAQKEAKAFQKAVSRDVPEAKDLGVAMKRLGKALKPKGKMIDLAIGEAVDAIAESQKILKDTVTRASRARCEGASIPSAIDSIFHLTEYQANERAKKRTR